MPSRRVSTQSDLQSRNSSKKKYIGVVSKELGTTIPTIMVDLNQSMVLLPHEHGENIRKQLRSSSQDRFGYTQSVMIQRSSSLSHFQPAFQGSQQVLMREIIKAVPVTFKYSNPKHNRISTQNNEPIFVNNRHSLPTKKSILLKKPTKSIHPLTFMHEQHHQVQRIARYSMPMHHMPQNFHTPSFIARPNILQLQTLKQTQTDKSNTYLSSIGKPTISIQFQQVLPKQPENLKLSLNNSLDLEEQINLGQCQPSSLHFHPMHIDNYNSLDVVKEDIEGNLKQNLDIKAPQCICQEIMKIKKKDNNANGISKQILQPKKNFAFY